MNDTRAAIADLAVAGVAAIALVYVLKNQPLRRAVWHVLTYVVFTAGPSYLWHETTRAWAESAHN